MRGVRRRAARRGRVDEVRPAGVRGSAGVAGRCVRARRAEVRHRDPVGEGRVRGGELDRQRVPARLDARERPRACVEVGGPLDPGDDAPRGRRCRGDAGRHRRRRRALDRPLEALGSDRLRRRRAGEHLSRPNGERVGQAVARDRRHRRGRLGAERARRLVVVEQLQAGHRVDQPRSLRVRDRVVDPLHRHGRPQRSRLDHDLLSSRGGGRPRQRAHATKNGRNGQEPPQIHELPPRGPQLFPSSAVGAAA